MCGPVVARNTHTNVSIPIVTIYFQRFPGDGGETDARSVGRAHFTCYLICDTGRREFLSRSRLNSDGSVQVPFAPGVRRVELEIFGTRYEIERVTALQPVNTDAGLAQRLSSLGYWVGFGRENVVYNFQVDNHLPGTGEVDQQTRDLLVQRVGG